MTRLVYLQFLALLIPTLIVLLGAGISLADLADEPSPAAPAVFAAQLSPMDDAGDDATY